MRDIEEKELHRRIWVFLLVSLLALAMVVWLGPKLVRFFLPLIIAWVLASLANPMVVFLENRIKILRKHGSVIVIVCMLLLVGGLIYLAADVTVRQVSSLVEDLPGVYEQVMDNLRESLSMLHHRFDFIPEDIQQVFGKNNDKLNDMILSFLDSLKTDSIAAVGSFASSVIDIFVLVVLVLMLSYFFVAKHDEVLETARKCIPQGIKDFWNMAMDTCLRALVGYLKACFQIMIIIFVILLIIFGGVMQVKYASLLALLTAIFDFLPFFGAGMILMPWAVYCVITGSYIQAVILAATYIICLMAHRLLEPKLVGDSVGMSPFATLVSMFIGYRLIGMLGLIVGIPVGMVVIAFKEKGVFEPYVRGIKILARDISEYRKF